MNGTFLRGGASPPPAYAVCTVWSFIPRSPGKPARRVSASSLRFVAYCVTIDFVVLFHVISNNDVANHASIGVLIWADGPGFELPHEQIKTSGQETPKAWTDPVYPMIGREDALDDTWCK